MAREGDSPEMSGDVPKSPAISQCDKQGKASPVLRAHTDNFVLVPSVRTNLLIIK